MGLIHYINERIRRWLAGREILDDGGCGLSGHYDDTVKPGSKSHIRCTFSDERDCGVLMHYITPGETIDK